MSSFTKWLLYFLITPVRVWGQQTDCADINNIECDRLALEAIKNRLNDTSQEFYSSWSGENPCDGSWLHVECNELQQRVTKLVFGKKKWEMTEDGSVNYTRIEDEYWHWTYFDQVLPVELTKMHFLQYMQFSHSNFSGQIFPEISTMTNLVVIDLESNVTVLESNLTGNVPSEISVLEYLQVLDVYQNKLTGSLPAEISTLSNLQFLIVQSNNLIGSLPPEFSSLIKLEEFSAAKNQINGSLPTQYCELVNLIKISVSHNNITGSLPPSYSNLTNLKELYLQYNKITGSLPEEYSKLTQLKYFAVTENQIEGILPIEYSTLVNLVKFAVRDNRITGSFPSQYSTFSNLKQMYLQNNYITGGLPVLYSALSDTTKMQVENNTISDSYTVKNSALKNNEKITVSGSNISDTCKMWQHSQDLDHSYYVQMYVEEDLQFCSGVMVEKNWVLTSNSCFQRILQYTQNYLSHNKYDNTNCLHQNILVKSVAHECNNNQHDDANFSQVYQPEYYQTYGKYKMENGNFLNENKTIHVNNFLLLKLRDSKYFLDVLPVQLSAFDYDAKDNYEIFFQVLRKFIDQEQNQTFLSFGQTNVILESPHNNFTCQEFCAQNNKICYYQEYLCGIFNISDATDQYSFLINSGDPLVRRKDPNQNQNNSTDVEIVGFFSNDLISQKFKENYYNTSKDFFPFKSRSYSTDSDGTIFVALTEEILTWIYNTINQYHENQCTGVILEEKVPQKLDYTDTIIVVVSVFGGIFFVSSIAGIILCFLWPRCTRQNIGEGDRYISETTKEEVSGETIENIQQRADSVPNVSGNSSGVEGSELERLHDLIKREERERNCGFNQSPNMFTNIRIPKGVTDIPMSDLKEVQPLGSGGFAMVYEVVIADDARDKYLNLSDKHFALKIIHKELTQKGQLEAIIKEIEIMKDLNSEYVVQLIGASLQIRPSIVMELVSDGSLESLLQSESFKSYETSLQWKLQLMLNISQGIHYLHSKGITHRDLKPQNILVQNKHNATIKITDFGISKTMNAATSIQVTNCVGTVAYMAPEMFEECLRITNKVDVWALGVVMQEIIRGVKPWSELNKHQIMGQLTCHKKPPANGELPQQGCPKELRSLIERCWNKAKDRPSAEEVVNLLDQILMKEIDKMEGSKCSSKSSRSSSSSKSINFQQ